MYTGTLFHTDYVEKYGGEMCCGHTRTRGLRVARDDASDRSAVRLYVRAQRNDDRSGFIAGTMVLGQTYFSSVC